jgi:hypothetical protein
MSRTTGVFRDPAPKPRNEIQGGWNIWIPGVMIVATAAAILVPLAVIIGPSFIPGYTWFDWFVTVVLLVDALVGARLDRDTRGSFRPWLRAADILAALPLFALTGLPALLFVRMLKLIRVGFWMSIWRQQHFSRWNALRLIYFAYWLGLIVHWLASGWLVLRMIGGHTGDSWTLYLHALYWCISTVTTIGYGDITPQSNAEIIYAMGVMIFGVGMYGYVIANISTIIANLQPARVRYLETMERLGAFMRYQRLPTHLQKRIREYYTYLWEQRMGYNESSILHDLPPGLLAEVSLFMKRDIIRKVPFFREADENLVRDIALQMRPVVYTPGDIVVREGDPGNGMYFIARGRLDVLQADGTPVTAVCEGEFFGEMALVLQQPRMATIRATTYCDLYFLDKEGFERVIRVHPSFVHHLRQMTEERQKG